MSGREISFKGTKQKQGRVERLWKDNLQPIYNNLHINTWTFTFVIKNGMVNTDQIKKAFYF